jgi:hypothetical protein
MTALPQTTSVDRVEAHRPAGSYFCPQCLKRVPVSLARRRAHRETCASGTIDVVLLHCPTCGLTLAAEAEPTASWTQTVA